MIIVPKNNLYLPRRLWPSKNKQRGSIGMVILGAVTGGSVPASWTLSGLSGTYADTATTDEEYFVAFLFRTTDDLDILRGVGADSLNEVDPFRTPSGEPTWVRCTNNSGDDMTSGDSRGAWHSLTSTRQFRMTLITSGPEELMGNFDFELSSDASGSPIEATASNITVHVGDLL